MKIAVTAKGAGLGAWLDPDFVHCRQIVIVDEKDRFEAWTNPGTDDEQALIQVLVQHAVGVFITGPVSPATQASLAQAGITVEQVQQGTVLDLVEQARQRLS